MKKNYFLFVLLLSIQSWAQCDISLIDSNSWTVVYTDSEWSTDYLGEFAIDGDPASIWHTASGVPYPHEIQVDLGAEYSVSGIGILPRQSPTNAKVKEHEIFLSNDGITWLVQGGGTFNYDNESDTSIKQSTFYAIDARYLKIIGLSGYADDYMAIAELEVYQDLVCSPTGQDNQLITFEEILDKGTEDDPFEINASSNYGLDLTFEIVSGPATVNDNIITLTGAPGVVELKATQAGNEDYYPSENTTNFEVIDLSLYYPDVTTSFIDDFPLEMPSLMAYPIYINSSIIVSDDLINIQQVDLLIGDDTFTAEEQDGFYYYLWTPTSFGSHTIDIKAIASNGNESIITRNIDVTDSYATQTVGTLEDIVIEFGGENSRWYYGTYNLPQFVGAYENLNAFLDVECPNIGGGCDDWDRWAHIDIKAPDGNWVQLIRYITPYGVACDHELNVTDYSSLLQGQVEFRVFIDTWGTGGWQLTLDIDYTVGTPTFNYSTVTETWDGSYSFGNPANLQPVETYNAGLTDEVEASFLRLSNTGHGWGSNNTGNAAEFFNAYHFIDLDGEQTFIQHLWNDCNPNPDNCTGQQGTWQYDRAGWCPGAIAPPNIYDLTPYIGTSIDIDYRFHPTYEDFCHPNNSECVSGVTCSDCNDGYNPVYYVDGQIINYSSQPIVYGNYLGINSTNELIFNVSIYPNPSNGFFNIYTDSFDGSTRVTVHSIDGNLIKSYYFNSSSEMSNTKFDLSNLSSGIYFVNIDNKKGTGTKKIIID
jgi:hypothetical protein